MNSMTCLFLITGIIGLLFLLINGAFAPHKPYPEKYSIFECGYHSFIGQNRTQFVIQFFIYGFLYLLLDLEILLTYPYAVSGYINSSYGLTISLSFIMSIFIGFTYELGKSALNIDSRQSITSKTSLNAK